LKHHPGQFALPLHDAFSEPRFTSSVQGLYH
jgi:hypothetical protein